MCNQTNKWRAKVNKKQSNILEISWKVLLFCFGGSWKRLISCYTFGVNERVSVAAVVATSTTTTTLVKIVCKISVWKFLWWTQCVSVSRVFSVGNSINYHQYGYSCGDGDGDASAVGNHAPWSSRYALHFLYIQFSFSWKFEKDSKIETNHNNNNRNTLRDDTEWKRRRKKNYEMMMIKSPHRKH